MRLTTLKALALCLGLALVALALPTVPAQAITGQETLTRAQSWVDAHVGYSMTGYYTNQYGTYRTDCSGYVSMAWGLGTSYTTVTLPNVSTAISKDALQPGDILLNPASGGAGHVVLFAGWANSERTRYNAYESSPAYNGAHYTTSIPYPYWSGYGTFSPRRYNALHAGPIADGTFVSHGGHVYRIAGGAPIWVSDWARVGGPQPTRALSDAEFASLRQQPVDGTFISSPPPPAGSGEVYRVAGGAPIYVTYNWWKTMNPTPPVTTVSQEAIDQAGQPGAWSHLNYKPAEGTFVGTPGAPAGRGEIYRIAGGAPIYVTYNWWKTMNPTPPVTQISQEAVDQAGQSGAWSHLNYRPADGTFISSPGAPAGRGEVYRMAGGAPIYVSLAWWKTLKPTPSPIVVSQEAIDQADKPGAWSHMRYYPADNTLVSANGDSYLIKGAVPRRITPPKGGLPIDPAAIANAGKTGVWSHLKAETASPTGPPPPPTGVAPRRAISGVRSTLKSKRRIVLRWKPIDGAQRYGVDLLHGHKRLGTSTGRARIVLKVRPGTRYTAIISVVRGATDVDAATYRFRVKR